MLEVEQQRLSAASRRAPVAELREPAPRRAARNTAAGVRDRPGHDRPFPRALRAASRRPARRTRGSCRRSRRTSGRSSQVSTRPSRPARRSRTSPARRSSRASRSAPKPASRARCTAPARRTNTCSPRWCCAGTRSAAARTAPRCARRGRSPRSSARPAILPRSRCVSTCSARSRIWMSPRPRSRPPQSAPTPLKVPFASRAASATSDRSTRRNSSIRARALTDARLNLTRVRAEYLARLAELEYAVGGTRALGEEPAS